MLSRGTMVWFVLKMLRDFARISRTVHMVYYWAIVLALCFGCFRLSAIFPVVVSVPRRCKITVLLYDMEVTHCLYHGNYPRTVHVIVYDHCLYVQARKLPMERCPPRSLHF